jgi:hypothetical protein
MDSKNDGLTKLLSFFTDFQKFLNYTKKLYNDAKKLKEIDEEKKTRTNASIYRTINDNDFKKNHIEILN